MMVTRLSIVDWVLFRDSDFAGDLEDAKPTSGGVLCIFGNRTFVPISKKQTSVPHSSTESEIISLDAGLRMDGLLALDLWDKVIEVPRSTSNTARQSELAQGNLCTAGNHSPTEKRKREVEQLSNVDYVHPNTHSSQGGSPLYNFEDNEPVIKMTIKGRSPIMRQVSRTHRVANTVGEYVDDIKVVGRSWYSVHFLHNCVRTMVTHRHLLTAALCSRLTDKSHHTCVRSHCSCASTWHGVERVSNLGVAKKA